MKLKEIQELHIAKKQCIAPHNILIEMSILSVFVTNKRTYTFITVTLQECTLSTCNASYVKFID